VDKLKVIWICHFSNSEIQEKLKPFKRINEFAPWITSLIKVIEEEENIELNVISPHEYISGYKKFTLRGIIYHFFNAHIPIWGRHWPGFLKIDDWTNYLFNKIIVHRIVNKIKPDIIHLHGAENAYYSSTINQFKDKYPILITLQGFLHKVIDQNSSIQLKKRARCEFKIYKSFMHFGIRSVEMGKVIQSLNPNAILHWHGYGIKISSPVIKTNILKKYDLVYFARITKIKGIEDFLKVVSLLKQEINNISAIIIGPSSPDYLLYLKNLASNLFITENIKWIGFLPTQLEVHKAALQARISVLPVKYDMIPGTIVESMYLKIPVVTYNVGSIPEVNAKEKVIMVVEKDDIRGMVDAIKSLLYDENLYHSLANKAYQRIIEMIDYDNVKNDLLQAYNSVIDDYKNNKCYYSGQY